WARWSATAPSASPASRPPHGAACSARRSSSRPRTRPASDIEIQGPGSPSEGGSAWHGSPWFLSRASIGGEWMKYVVRNDVESSWDHNGRRIARRLHRNARHPAVGDRELSD